jgi:hypothetical protein
MINELAKQVHENAKAHGFFDKERNIGEMLCLIHSEVSEALEADRKDNYCVLYNDTVLQIIDKSDFADRYKSWIKGTFEEKMADIFIRVMDLCAFKGINLEAHIKAKMRYNSLREYKHGKKY